MQPQIAHPHLATSRDALALHADAVRYSFGAGFSLGPISFDLAFGEVAGLIGPNGSGKSTLLKLLAHGLPVGFGSVEVAGRHLSQLSRRALARLVAVLPQSVVVPPGYSVHDVVSFGRTAYTRILVGPNRQDREAIERGMTMTDVAYLAHRDFSTLSNGEQQRVLLAMALAQETPILLLDEPTSHLDIHHSVELLDLLIRLQRECRLTVLLSVHDLNLAALYCPRLLLLARGKLLRDGTPEDVLQPALLARAFGPGLRAWKHPTRGTPVVLPEPDPNGDREPGRTRRQV
ncbi:MAG: ABC transporter ATP-binding protein [Chloroflexi bacterium]|nr:ABC transporter ATP-binding protein [Chloroflexota bacterium]